ncbi:hypothetical protein DSM112329_04268 [Paraconexibacter sp. AEG42_29]|uniref:Uncharacterized protein n=1 Tax=Paraconexibacter sp. AEG42_29 TaxID=2997339 RepID=A0AAU7B176_9ACTN
MFRANEQGLRREIQLVGGAGHAEAGTIAIDPTVFTDR